MLHYKCCGGTITVLFKEVEINFLVYYREEVNFFSLELEVSFEEIALKTHNSENNFKIFLTDSENIIIDIGTDRIQLRADDIFSEVYSKTDFSVCDLLEMDRIELNESVLDYIPNE